MSTKPGELVDSFTLESEDGQIYMEIRLMHADDGTEMLWHYEGDHLLLVHPAARCARCNTLITGDHAGGCCFDCIDVLVIG